MFDIAIIDDFTLEDGKYTIMYTTLQTMCRNVRTDSVIKITNSAVNTILLFQISNGFRTVVYQCPCSFINEKYTTQRTESEIPYVQMKTIELKDICKSLVNTTETFLIEQFENGLVISTIDSVLNQSVVVGIVDSDFICSNVIPNIILQRLL